MPRQGLWLTQTWQPDNFRQEHQVLCDILECGNTHSFWKVVIIDEGGVLRPCELGHHWEHCTRGYEKVQACNNVVGEHVARSSCGGIWWTWLLQQQKTGLGMECTSHIPDALFPCNRPFLKSVWEEIWRRMTTAIDRPSTRFELDFLNNQVYFPHLLRVLVYLTESETK